MPHSEVHNIDCLEFMKTLPDKFFDLAIVDPPYGIGEDGSKNKSRGLGIGSIKKKALGRSKDYKPYSGGDKTPPPPEYFTELYRVSKNQIIWGANHFLAKTSPCWIVWDKENGSNDFADCELAFTSFNTAVRKFTFKWHGMIQGDMKNKEVRLHPNQKPVALYKWLLQNYAKQGDKIFDSHMGSQSSRIAAYHMGFDYWGCELDKDYFNDGNKRFEREKMKQELFAPQQSLPEQIKLL